MKQLFKKKMKKSGRNHSKTATINFAKSTKFSKPVKNSKSKSYKGLCFGLKKYSKKKKMYAKKYKSPTQNKVSFLDFHDKECSTQEATESCDS